MLVDIDGFTHQVCVLPVESTIEQPALSLREIISRSLGRDCLARLSHYERLHLARTLATFVLQYCNTPWLSDEQPWKSDDIYFLESTEGALLKEPYQSLSEPHIKVPIREPTSGSLLGGGQTSSTTEHLAPNVLLYNLGVILLELAFNTPIKELLQAPDLSSDGLSQSEFIVARRLANIVSRHMGLKYGEIVKKCIGCHFSSGSDFSDSRLQEEYFCDVVSELEALKKDFEPKNLGV